MVDCYSRRGGKRGGGCRGAERRGRSTVFQAWPTAAGRAAMIELFLVGKLPQKGFVRQEDAKLADFLSTNAGSRLTRGSRGADLAKTVWVDMALSV